MTAWTQHHPTQTMTTPSGEKVEIDVEMVPLIRQVWRLGYATLLCCQDAGESILNGGTRTPADQRDSAAARNQGRAWVKVLADQCPRLLAALEPLSASGGWTAHPSAQPGQAEWYSITFPRAQIKDAADLLYRRERA